MKAASFEMDAVLRRDFHLFVARCFMELNPDTPFRDNWHLDLLCSKLEACARGEIKRLIINVPPRSLKSIATSVALTAWLLGHHPSRHIMNVTYAQDLSDKMARDTKQIMESHWYRRMFKKTRISPRRTATSDFSTTQGGSRHASSIGGVLTGRGADLIIVDDPLKPDEALSDTVREKANEWVGSTLLSRLDDKQNGCIIVVMQRLHENDLSGYLMAQGGWEVLSLPAIALEDEQHVWNTPLGRRTHIRQKGEALHPEREPLEVLQQIRKTMGEYNFAGQYLQRPAPPEGGMIKLPWFERYDRKGPLPTFERIICSWDTANKETELADYSVCTVWGIHRKKLYLLRVYRERLDYPSLRRRALEIARIHKATALLIEDKASGTQLIQDLKRERLTVKPYKFEGNKVMRANTVTGMIERGEVYLPTEAPWLEEFERELMYFPKGRHDDQVDSMTQMLDWVQNTPRGWDRETADAFGRFLVRL